MAIYLKKDLKVKEVLPKVKFVDKLNPNKIHVKVGILNLMPTLEDTERQLIEVLDNPLMEIELDFIYLDTKKTEEDKILYYKNYYRDFLSIKKEYYDGMIITGAPLEHIPYPSVTYIEELKEFFKYTKTHVKSTLFLCWAAEFGLQYFYGVNRYYLKEKASGLYKHYSLQETNLVRGLDENYYIPISRYCSIIEADITKRNDLVLASKSNATGPYIVESVDGSKVFLTGHAEYEADTLKKEYERDIKKGLDIKVPKNYFPSDDASKKPIFKWCAARTIIYHNWLYYYVYKQ